ncbi:hypothetical protein BY458DRAFT_494190 [Sporodiniella umbellata]|nr:hypothetical protein BY458DRAFT_494190 [Sporodiniella umbellata]
MNIVFVSTQTHIQKIPNTRNNLVIQSYEQIVPSSYSNVTNPLFGVILRPCRGPVMTGYRSNGFVSSQRPSGVTWGLGTCESFITSTRIGELYGTCRAKIDQLYTEISVKGFNLNVSMLDKNFQRPNRGKIFSRIEMNLENATAMVHFGAKELTKFFFCCSLNFHLFMDIWVYIEGDEVPFCRD